MEQLDVPPTARGPLAQHSNASPEWGTNPLLQRFAACILRPSAVGDAIDLDYSSSAYWHSWWPDQARPAAYLDGSPGRDVIEEHDRRAAIAGQHCGSGFENPPGLNGGRMIQKCWAAMEADHRSGWLGSGFWVGFSVEQLASLQGVAPRNPLTITKDDLITTFFPSRRVRYQLHPEAYIAVLQKKQGRRERGSKEWIAEQKMVDSLRQRTTDAPVIPPAPPHSSFATVLWNRDRGIRRRQMDAARGFLDAQRTEEKSLLQEVAIVGEIEA